MRHKLLFLLHRIKETCHVIKRNNTSSSERESYFGKRKGIPWVFHYAMQVQLEPEREKRETQIFSQSETETYWKIIYLKINISDTIQKWEAKLFFKTSKVISIEKPKYYLIQRSKVLHKKLQCFSCSRNSTRFGRLEVLLPSSKEPPMNKTILNDLIQLKYVLNIFLSMSLPSSHL